jgi:hypothetical protein
MNTKKKSISGKILSLFGSFHGLAFIIAVWLVSSFTHQIRMSGQWPTTISTYDLSLTSMISAPSISSLPQKSLGRIIVERSYRQSWRDLTTKLCPVVRYPNVTTSPPSVDFYITCLGKAKRLMNTHRSPYHDKWPWWFRTLLRDAPKQSNGMQGPWHVLQFSNPDLRLCVYEKGGTKQFKQFHCRHIHNYPTDLEKLPEFNQCWNQQPKYATVPNSDKAVFLRDPLDRFLSGFLDKCIRHRDGVDHCEPTTVFHNKSTSPVTDLMLNDDRKFFEMYVDTFPLQWNMHFIPQSLNCGGLYRDIEQYAFVGSMGVEFYRDLARLKNQYPQLERGIEQIFKLNEHGKSNVTNDKGVETGAAGRVLDYFTPYTVRRVLEYYAVDYVLLNLTIPQWAEDMLRLEANDQEKTQYY